MLVEEVRNLVPRLLKRCSHLNPSYNQITQTLVQKKSQVKMIPSVYLKDEYCQLELYFLVSRFVSTPN